MDRFDDRLARTAGSLLGLALLGGLTACSGQTKPGTTGTTGDTGTTTTVVDLAAICTGATPPEDFQLATGHVLIEPGGVCPDAADAQLEVLGCTFLEWQGITCSFTEVAHDQVFVNDGYGGYYANETTAPTTGTVGTTTTPEVVDVCYYQGVFFLPPDHPTCGRPLLHEGAAVIAEVRPGRSGWATAATPIVGDLTAAEREQVGEHWLASALMEHASIASFAHFSLDLMRLGAPPELLAGAQQAALDEIEHAKLCFSLASGYRGAPVGPGRLGAEGLPSPATTLGEVAEALVREGCIGETLAALDAAARLAVARDPAVRAALQVIFRDRVRARLARLADPRVDPRAGPRRLAARPPRRGVHRGAPPVVRAAAGPGRGVRRRAGPRAPAVRRPPAGARARLGRGDRASWANAAVTPTVGGGILGGYPRLLGRSRCRVSFGNGWSRSRWSAC